MADTWGIDDTGNVRHVQNRRQVQHLHGFGRVHNFDEVSEAIVMLLVGAALLLIQVVHDKVDVTDNFK